MFTSTPNTTHTKTAAVPVPSRLAKQLPDFTPIDGQSRVDALQQLIETGRQQLSQLLNASSSSLGWDNVMQPLESINDAISHAFSTFNHLNSVCNSAEDRDAHQQAQAQVNAYFTDLSQNADLFHHCQALSQGAAWESLTAPQQQALSNQLRDFHLSGIDLPQDQQAQLKELRQTHSAQQTTFANHVMDATQGWYKHLTHASSLSGLPDNALQAAANAAKQKELNGFVITLDAPSYLAIMTYAEDRQLRAEVYHAYVTRASERYINIHGDPATDWDNGPLMRSLLSLRHQQASLLSFDSYAHLSLARKMADTPEVVEQFLLELAEKSKPAAQRELEELQAFAKTLGIPTLQAWDVAFCSEKLKEQSFGVSDEILRAYFPVRHVLKGLFELIHRLFDVEIRPCHSVSTWHDSVLFFKISRNDQVIAGFYLDLFARDNKRGGAWMDECRVRRRLDSGEDQLPVAYLVCNFAPPTDEDTPALLSHNDVTTLFHEVGHGLHHMLTQVSVADVSGINGVEWDAVELPSQFMENWCWQPDILELISRHHETDVPLPKDLLEQLLAAKNFQAGLKMLRQIEFALFDWRIHWRYQPEQPEEIEAVLQSVRDHVSVLHPPEFNRFANSFSHIFAGGYSAGYYSYKWAEVLSSDAFARFEEEGLWNPAIGHAFLQEILEVGGSRPAKASFEAFRQRSPSVEALLRHSGLLSDNTPTTADSSSDALAEPSRPSSWEQNEAGSPPATAHATEESIDLGAMSDAHYHQMPPESQSAGNA